MGANIGKFQTAKADALRQWRRAATLSAGETMEGMGVGDAVGPETNPSPSHMLTESPHLSHELKQLSIEILVG